MAATIHTSGELKSRMSTMENTLRTHARSASFGAGLTLLVGVVLIAGLSFYFWYGFHVIGGFLSEKTAANNIIDIVEGQLNDNLDPARKYLEDMVKDNAGSWAQMASDSVVGGIPTARDHGVVFAVSGLEQSLAESNKHAKDMVVAHLRKNEAKIRDAVKRLSSADAKEADQFLADLREAFAKDVEVDLDSVVKQTNDFIDGFNGLLGKTKSDSVRLTQLQAMQREILMLFKRAMIEHTKDLAQK